MNREPRDLRPDEVVGRRFGWRPWGISRREVRRLLLEIVAELDHTRKAWAMEVLECRRLENALAATVPVVQELRAQVTAVRKQLNTRTANTGGANARADARRGQGGPLLAAAPLNGERTVAAGREVEEIATAARLMAETMIREAQQIAADTLRSARTVAQLRLRAANRRVPWGPAVGHVPREEWKRVAQSAERQICDLMKRLEALHGTTVRTRS